MARFLGARPNRGDTYLVRLQRMREEGHAKGSAEGKLFLRAFGKTKFQPHEVHEWLSRVVAQGRAELEAQQC